MDMTGGCRTPGRAEDWKPYWQAAEGKKKQTTKKK